MALSKPQDQAAAKAVATLDQRLTALERLLPLQGTIVEVELNDTFVRVPHGLGRPYQGFIPLDGVPLVDDKTVKRPERELWLRGSAPWTLIEKKEVATATGSIVFEDLDGDTDQHYVLVGQINYSSGFNLYLEPNSTTANQNYVELAASGAGVSDATSTGLLLSNIAANQNILVQFVAKSGVGRSVYSLATRISNGRQEHYTGGWNDTTTKVTSIELTESTNGIGVGSAFWLYALGNRPTKSKVWVF